MPQFTIFNTVDGSIVRSGTHPAPETIELDEDQALDLTGAYSGDDSRYVDGVREAYAPPVSPDQLQRDILMATQARLDDFARTRNYDSILSAATYAGDPVPQFAAEGQRAIELRGQTWAKLYQMLAEVQAGTRMVPSGYADIEAELPALTWPEEQTQ